jgi:radical SAM protein with 4Fe4S-binding SPASM domain
VSSANEDRAEPSSQEIDHREDDWAKGLLRQALERFETFGSALDEPSRALWLDAYEGWLAKIGPGGPETHFFGPRTTPAFQLLAWIAESLWEQPKRQPAVISAAEAMVALYMAVRVQDDVIDEGDAPELIFLEHLLTARALTLLVEAAGEPLSILDQWGQVTRDFANAALIDLRLRQNPDAVWTEDHIDLQGLKYLPMYLPLAALMIRGGQSDALDDLRLMIERLAVGLQLGNDLFGAPHDLDTEQRSPYLAALKLVPGLHRRADLAPALARGLRSGAYLRYMDRIELAFDEAQALAPRLPSDRLVCHLRERRDALRRVRLRQSMQGLVGAPRLSVDLEVTQRCNLDCASCFVMENVLDPQGGRPDEIPLALMLEVLDELSGYRTHLHLTGGEPFLYHELWPMLERAAELGFEDLTINTNATLVDELALARLSALPLRVRLLVSLDGPPGTHDAVRGAGVEAAAITLLARDLPERVSAVPASVLTKELIAFGLREWVAWLEQKRGATRQMALWPLFRPRGGRDRREGMVGTPLEPEGQIETARQVVALRDGGVEVVVADHPIINPLLRRLGVPREHLWQCGAGRSRLCVQADGSITPCHPLRYALERLEPGRVGGFVARARSHPTSQRLARRDHEGCLECPERDICGSCQAVVDAQDLPMFTNKGYCTDTILRWTGSRGGPSEHHLTRRGRV